MLGRASRIALAAVLCFGLLSDAASGASARMVLEGLNGDVTTNETASFIKAINALPSPPSNNIGNTLVYESAGGARLHGMQTFYSFTKDKRVLDVAILWSDAFLNARNDPVSGRIVWTGKRELCWPNKADNDVQALYSGTENGDVIEHIINTAKLILENPSLWTQSVPTDRYNLGATYLERARTYVRECQRSAESTIVPWYVRQTKSGYRLYHPDAEAYWKACSSRGPVPWNQQQFIVGGLLRLAQCHRLLNDGNINIAYYERITGDAADWFSSTSLLVSAKGRNCYDWSYDLTRDIGWEPEDTGHSFYDVYVMRAYQAHLGPSRTNLQRLVNTARFVMNVGTNRFSGLVNGSSTKERPERKYLNYEWIEMSVLDRNLYTLLGNAVLDSHEYLEDVPVEAAVLYAKHYWATTPATSDAEAIVDDVTGTPPVPNPRRRPPPAAMLGMLWGLSEFLLTVTKRSKSNAISKDRHSLRLIWLGTLSAIFIAIVVSYKLSEFRLPWPKLSLMAGCSLMAMGLGLRWYAVIHLGRFFTTNVAIADDHQLVDSGPYRFVRHPSYTGSLIAVLGLGLSFQNWLSLLIIVGASFAVTRWRIRIEEQALMTGLGQSYEDYSRRTKRLIPFIY